MLECILRFIEHAQNDHLFYSTDTQMLIDPQTFEEAVSGDVENSHSKQPSFNPNVKSS